MLMGLSTMAYIIISLEQWLCAYLIRCILLATWYLALKFFYRFIKQRVSNLLPSCWFQSVNYWNLTCRLPSSFLVFLFIPGHHNCYVMYLRPPFETYTFFTLLWIVTTNNGCSFATERGNVDCHGSYGKCSAQTVVSSVTAC